MKPVSKTIGQIRIVFAALALSVLLAPASVQAQRIDNITLAQSVKTELNREHIDRVLSRQEVREKLAANGVSSTMLEQRLNAMTDQEIADLAANFDQAPAGAGGLEVLAMVFIVLMVTDAIGITDVFNFIRPIR